MKTFLTSLCLILSFFKASAVTYVVSNTNDNGLGSLRHAIAIASSGDSIVFDTYLHNNPIHLHSTIHVHDKNLVILGNGRTLTIISGQNQARPFFITGTSRVTFKNLTIRDGKAPLEYSGVGTDSTLYGGAIRNEAYLRLENCILSNNLAEGFAYRPPAYEDPDKWHNARGGAIYSSDSLFLINTEISQNEAIGGYGGGLFTSGYASISASRISSNLANGNDTTYVSGKGFGGASFAHPPVAGAGIYNTGELHVDSTFIESNLAVGGEGAGLFNSGTAILFSVTFRGNRGHQVLIEATISIFGVGYLLEYGDGAGIYTNNSLNAVNCLFHGNYIYPSEAFPFTGLFSPVVTRGGAMYAGGTVNLNQCTLAGNYIGAWRNNGSSGSCSLNPAQGMGLYVPAGATVTVNNSIISENHVIPPPGCYGAQAPLEINNNVYGTFTGSHNLIDTAMHFVDPVLAQGETTAGNYRLKICSPGIEGGDNSLVSTITDLDGNPRTFGSITDIGAFELQEAPDSQAPAMTPSLPGISNGMIHPFGAYKLNNLHRQYTLSDNCDEFFQSSWNLKKDTVLTQTGSYHITIDAADNMGNAASYSTTLNLTACVDSFALSGPEEFVCWGNTDSLELSGSITGNNYFLISDDHIIHGPVNGTGSSIRFFPGTLQSDSTFQVYAENPLNYALDLNGSSDNAQIASHPNLLPANEISIEAWVKPDQLTATTYQEIYRKEDGGNNRHLLSFQDNGSILSFGLSTGGNYSELDVPIQASDYEGKWTHIAATYDGFNKRIFVNGEQIGLTTTTGTLHTSGTANGIIGSLQGIYEFFDGKIDEVKLWSRALSQADIQLGMNPCALIDTTGLIFWLPMNEGFSDSLYDVSTNGHHAQLSELNTAHSNPANVWNQGVWQPVSNRLNIQKRPYHYVDQQALGTQTGCSWANAYLTITDALNSSSVGDTIYIAEGDYQEIGTLNVAHSLDFFGGFPTGGGIQDPKTQPVFVNGGANHRVFNFLGNQSLIVLNGLNIVNGLAVGDTALGGGAYIDSASVVIINGYINANHAKSTGRLAAGGGIYNLAGTLKLLNSTMEGNTAVAMDSVISSGDANAVTVAKGGAFYNGGTAELLNVKIHKDTATAYAYAYTDGGSEGFASSSIYSAASGGGIYNAGNLRLENSEISGNLLKSGGLSEGNSFFLDEAYAYGGGLYSMQTGTHCVLVNSTIAKNNAQYTSSPTLAFMEATGGGIFAKADSILNTVTWGNTAHTDSNAHFLNSPIISRSLIGGQNPGGDNLGGNLNPMFSDTAAFNFLPLPGSPLIDSAFTAYLPLDLYDVDGDGNTSEVMPFDLTEEARLKNCKPDIGAYEAPSFIVNNGDMVLGYEGETYTTGTYYAENLKTQGTFLNTDRYLLQAAKAICIEPGFVIMPEAGAVFEVKIGVVGCE